MIIKFETPGEAYRFNKLPEETKVQLRQTFSRIAESTTISDTTAWQDSQIGVLLRDFEEKFGVEIYFTVHHEGSYNKVIVLKCKDGSSDSIYFTSCIRAGYNRTPTFSQKSVYSDEFLKSAIDLCEKINPWSLIAILHRVSEVIDE